MKNNEPKINVRVDWYTRVCLTVIAVLLTLLALGLWTDLPTYLPKALAAEQPFGNAAGERKEITDATKEVTAKVDELLKLFKTGDAKVRLVQQADDQAASQPAGR